MKFLLKIFVKKYVMFLLVTDFMLILYNDKFFIRLSSCILSSVLNDVEVFISSNLIHIRQNFL